MTMLLECWRNGWRSLRGHPMRSLLSALGIVIGVAAVIAVIAIVQGLSRSVSENFDRLGANSLSVEAKTELEEALQGRRNRLGWADYRQILRQEGGTAALAASFAPFGDYGATVRYGRRTAFAAVNAVTASYQTVQQAFVREGRFIRNSDDRSRRKVCVIGSDLAAKLKLPERPEGEFVEVSGEWYKIIGVMEPRGAVFGVSRDNYLLIPFSAGQAALAAGNPPDLSIALNVADPAALEPVRQRLRALLRRLHRLGPGQADDFRIQSARQLSEAFHAIVDGMSLGLAGIVGISLLVGGIGIMNVMLVSVTERTREIGLLKALGARRAHILLQFLSESVCLSLAGGAAGVLGGYLLAGAFSLLVPALPAPAVPWWAVALALGFTVTVGLVFGLAPAVKAANLEPVEALRYE
ncbi:ABC transporter permease [Chromobacterium violaceum]|uniref:ABC transporter permease n=1 Tax=Chromobacterium violaceum TaxID=536 RepID=UPI0005D42635|nr:ABC transporter permease [Chromobacterium violaceum]KMN51563.1 hypothetical protein VK93_01810 [Chromobacterium violaceum]KMN86777.1 hypothetical protein VL02_06500 [Chromobacterium violaceum]KMN91829.1 hypothetical protein VL04_01745 [Chromobacterium violaceum]KMO05094.1 hypothetical protein VL16_03825 [Chromobacterium violaceum]MBP4051610.1 ABC transporter permease [Chromobacterium violaceum]